MRTAALFLAFAAALAAQTPAALEQCQTLRRHGQLPQAQACFGKLASSNDAYLRAEGLWGTEQYKEANDVFKTVIKSNPKNANYRVRWGMLFFERFVPSEAGGLFNEALEIDKNNADAYLGLAKVAALEYGSKAVECAQKAADLNPKLFQAHELLAYLALEDGNQKLAGEEADKALAISSEALDGMAIHAAIDFLHDRKESPWMDRILKVNPVYGEAYSTAGHFFFINRRYNEEIAAYKKALELNPRLWEARSQLGITLMQLGQEAEARAELEQCYNAKYTSTETVNALRLLDKYKDYETFKSDNTILRIHKKEAELLRPYFEPELKKIIATYEKKYQMKLSGPVQLEVYPDHDDFAVRTAGMPGLGGILGVTFEHVVAMDSPSGRPPGTYHWATTMWHEMSHVFVIQATHGRVPRWFTEGLAVYEETAASPDWGDRFDPEDIQAIQNKKLLGIAELERGFIRPTYPTQIVVSYYQGSKVVTFIVEKWGYSKILEMIQSFAKLESTPDVIEKDLGLSTEEFDKQFFAWLDTQTKTTVEHFGEWRKDLKQMVDDSRAKKWDDVIRKGTEIEPWYTDYVETGSVYELLSDAYTAKGDKASARKELEKYNQVGGRSSLLVERLATLEEEAGDPKKAAATLNRLNYIYPEDQELHKRLGDLWLAQNNVAGAIREYQALVALKPIDQAGAHYQLAKALETANRTKEAREEVLLSLEAAPGYKPAQKLLLEISK
ncbi:MAG TPA: tetratricopeptide repeat protein [Bryobacteraceae bacterium]|nr:tetratricopeptide repeat protein [Bryobacteraceae bacterium]